MFMQLGRNGYSPSHRSPSASRSPVTPIHTSPTHARSPMLVPPSASPQVPISAKFEPEAEPPMRTSEVGLHRDLPGPCCVVRAPEFANAEVKTEPYPCAGLAGFNTQIEELRQGCDTVTISALPGLWAKIKEKYGDTADYKLEYMEPNIIVTWPTQVHESFGEILTAFTEIQRRDPAFQCRFNESIELPTETAAKCERIPDFVLARKAVGAPEDSYLVILELAASQTEDSLSEKALKWLQNTDVKLVITINLDMAQYHAPPVRPAGPTASWDSFLATAQSSLALGAIVVQGHVWAHEIREIEAHLFTRGQAPETYNCTTVDVTPGSVDLATRLNQVTRSVARATRRAIGADLFATCFPEDDPFDLHWDSFFARITDARHKDAYKRYRWAMTAGPRPTPIPLKRNAVSDEFEDEEEAEALNRQAKRLRRAASTDNF
ncbi:hypothetical protein FB451DRAFT_1259280 [Mycena latifolia]|nr:hypothetical protein FB451DRAFT_1283480 [Mycena latifolia]KAJ7467747.1 hypothetical protein FB451DRAFT_1259280 [Mycena latifolia]